MRRGRFSDSFLKPRLPVFRQWQRAISWLETYSSGYCTGITPVSLSGFYEENPSPLCGGKNTLFYNKKLIIPFCKFV
jgi:hypothetical protein